MNNIKYSSKGFTLIEIVISLGILLVGILAILALFPIGFDSAKRSEDLTEATMHAQRIMEEIKNTGYPVIIPTTSLSSNRFTYAVNTAAVTVGTAAVANIQQVTVTVSWEYKGRLYNEPFVTLIPKLTP